jgi:drug/metabolite transporter (DMT)-like permease
MQVECQLANSYSKWQPTAMGPYVGGVGRLLALCYNLYFLSALVLYAGFALLWVWILSFTPLSRAYPFVALAFALTPLLAGLLFGETISLRLIIGLLLILGGLFFVTA